MKCTRPAPMGIGLELPGRKLVGNSTGTEFSGRHLTVNRSARLVRRPSGAGVASTVCLSDLGGLASTVPAIATSVAVVWGALMLSEGATHTSQGEKTCPACGGTGVEICFCNRWSDGDAGCNSCNHTGYMKCRRCGGGGTAVPIALSVRKDNSTGRPL